MASTDIRREHRLVWIDEANPEYPRSIQPVAAALAGRTLVPLLGAGISSSPPSLLPLAPDLMRPLRRALWGAILPCARQLRDPAFGRAVARRVVADARLERLLAVLQETHGRAAIERYLSVLDGRHWNRNHAAVAALAVSSYLPLCITLNFDLLIEEAVKAHDSACVTVCPLAGESGEEFRSGTGEPLIRILKPHGSLTPDDYPDGRFALLAVTLVVLLHYASP